MTLPTVVVMAVSFNPTAILAFPPAGFSLRWYVNALTYPQFQRAAVNSLLRHRGRRASSPCPSARRRRWRSSGAGCAAATPWATLLLSPLVVPGVAAGLGFLILAAGLGLLRSRTVMIVAHVALVLPFVVRSVWVSVKNLDPMLERAAASLGATPWRAFRRVTLPLAPTRPHRRAPVRGDRVGERVRRLALRVEPGDRDLARRHVQLCRELHGPDHRGAVELFIASTFAVVWLADRFFGLAAVFLLDR